MVKYISTFGIKPGFDREETWRLWQDVHVPRAIESSKKLVTKYVIFRLENADPDGKPELFGGVEMWFKDWDCAREIVKRMRSPASDEFAKRTTDLRRVFILEEKVVYEE
jgi:hypothetical protein